MQRSFLKIETFGSTDIGLARPNNEDVWGSVPNANFYVIADGMGGHSAGEIAAGRSVEHLCHLVSEYFNKEHKHTVDTLKHFLREAILDVNRTIYDLAAENPDWTGMGTTLSCVLVWDQVLLFAHVGDSRIYRFRDSMEQLTRDHTIRQNAKNFITKAIGTTPSIEPDIEALPVLADDIYLLCTDGLTDSLSSKEMSLILRKTSSLKEACDCLIKAAKNQGSGDNITVVIIKILYTPSATNVPDRGDSKQI